MRAPSRFVYKRCCRAWNQPPAELCALALLTSLRANSVYLAALRLSTLCRSDGSAVHASPNDLPAPFPGIASAGDILIAIAMVWLVASLMLRRPAADAAEEETDDAAAHTAQAEAAA